MPFFVFAVRVDDRDLKTVDHADRVNPRLSVIKTVINPLYSGSLENPDRILESYSMADVTAVLLRPPGGSHYDIYIMYLRPYKGWLSRLIRQHLASGFFSKRNNQQADPKSNRCERNRLPEGSHVSDERADSEVDPGGNEASERSGEREGRGAHCGPILFRQPETEHGEVAAKEAQKEQHRDEGMESLRQVKRPAKTEQDADEHPEEIESQRALAAEAFGQQRNGEAAQDGAERQQAHA